MADENAPVIVDLEEEAALLEDTEFPDEEFELPEQTPEDLGKVEEESK